MRTGWLIALSLGLVAMHAQSAEFDEGIEGGMEGEDGPMEGEDGPEGEDKASEEDHMQDKPLTAEQLSRLHAKFDNNGDGKVSLGEVLVFSRAVGMSIAKKGSEDLLEGMDTSGDGKLSLEEHLNFTQAEEEGGDEEQQKQQRENLELESNKFKAADKDSDRLVDQSELPALFYPEAHDHVMRVVAEQAFRQRDADKDGQLTQHEFWNEGDSEAEMTEEENSDFAKLDKNKDGTLDIDEFQAWESGVFHTEDAMEGLFKKADKDGDKHLTAKELAAVSDQLFETDAHHHLSEWAEHHEL